MNILEALDQLDHQNDEHWTADGAPRVDVIAELTGDKDIKRKDITDAKADFTRLPEGQREKAQQSNETQEEGQKGLKAVENATTNPDSESGSSASGNEPVVDEGSSEDDDEIPENWPTTCQEALELEADDFLENRDLFDPAFDLMTKEVEKMRKEIVEMTHKANALEKRSIDLKEFKAQTAPKVNSKLNWLKRQNEIRAKKAQKARDFVKNSGVNPDDIRQALNHRSPIDEKLRNRQVTRGPSRQMPAAKEE